MDALLEHVEVLALGNLDPVHPLRDPERLRRHQHVRRARRTPRFWRARARASRRSTSSSARTTPIGSSSSIAIGNGTLGEHAWIGWERKRGKIEEFNRLLRGATDTSFSTQVGELDVLPSVRYCLTLDSDTRLPRDAAKRLIGIIAHPLNQAAVRPPARARHRGLRDPAAARQRDDGERGRIALRAHLRRPHRRRSVHDRGLRRLPGSLRRRHLHRQRACTTSMRSPRRSTAACPENALLSHDLFEGLYARTALVTDVEVVDDYPSSVLAHARRQHRWVRGDWQILWWLFPFVPSRTGLDAQSPAAHRPLEDPRQPAAQPAAAGDAAPARRSAGPCCRAPRSRGRPSAWRRSLFPCLSRRARAAAGPAAPAVVARLPAHGGRGPRRPTRRAPGCSSPSWPTRRASGCTRSWSRSCVSASRAAACSSGRRRRRARRAAGTVRLRAFLTGMMASPLLALAIFVAVAALRPAALPVAAPILALWIAAPWIAFALSRPAPRRRAALSPADGAYLHDDRAEDVGVLRDLRRRRGPLPPAGQRPGRRRT